MEREEEERERRLEPLRLTCGDIKAVEVERKAGESSLTSTCQSLTRHHDTIITATLDSPSAPPSHCSRQTERDTDEEKSQRDDTHIHPCKMLTYNTAKNARALAWCLFEKCRFESRLMVCSSHVRKIEFMSRIYINCTTKLELQVGNWTFLRLTVYFVEIFF